MEALKPIRYIKHSRIRNDRAGGGRFGAPRGNRAHRGVDWVVEPGAPVLSPVIGVVSKLGICYEDDHSWRYVEVTDGFQRRHRLFYVLPGVEKHAQVNTDTPVGWAQDITQRYPGQGMTPHVHYEIMDTEDEYINPETLVYE